MANHEHVPPPDATESQEHSLLKDPLFLIVASAVLLSAGVEAGSWLVHKLRERRMQQTDPLNDPLASAAASAIDDAYTTRNRPLREGIEGALQGPLADDDRETWEDLLEVLSAREEKGVSSHAPSTEHVAHRFVSAAAGNIRTIARRLALLHHWGGVIERDHEQIAQDLSADGLPDVLKVFRLAEDFKEFGRALGPSIKLDLRERLRRGYRVYQPNSVDWKDIETIAQQRWPSSVLRAARHGIISSDQPMSPDTVLDPEGWLVCKSPEGKVLGYATYLPIILDPLDNYGDFSALSHLSLQEAYAMRSAKVAGSTLMITTIQPAREASSDAPSAALAFAIEDIAHTLGAKRVIAAAFSPVIARRQKKDIQQRKEPSTYRDLWAADGWNSIISAFAQRPEDMAFSDAFIDVVVPPGEIEQLAALQNTHPIEAVVRGEQHLYLKHYPVPLIRVDGEYHARIPAAFKLLYSKEAQGEYLDSVPLGERYAVRLFAGKAPEPPRDLETIIQSDEL